MGLRSIHTTSRTLLNRSSSIPSKGIVHEEIFGLHDWLIPAGYKFQNTYFDDNRICWVKSDVY